MIDVITPAATTALTTLDRVKASLGVTDDDSEDEFLEAQIAMQSDLVCAICNVAQAQDGSRTWGREEVEEIVTGTMLSRIPVVSIEAMTDGNGNVLDPADYLVDKVSGRIYGGTSTAWMNLVYNYTPPAIPLIVRYIAGYLLPNDDGCNLPGPIESATIKLVSGSRAGRGRDPNVKAEDIPGVLRTEYWVGSVSEGGVPPDVVTQLSPYRRHGV